MSLDIHSSTIDVLGLLNRAMGDIESGKAEENRSSKISVQGNKKFLEEKRQERLDKILENLKGIHHGKCLGFLSFIVKGFATIAAPFSGGASLALNLGGLLVNGLDRLQQAKAQKNYLLSKADEEMLGQIIAEVSKLFDDEIKIAEQGEEQNRRELVRMKEAVEQAAQGYEKVNF